MTIRNNWNVSTGQAPLPSLVPDELLDVEFVILLQGNNLFGDAVYSYLQLTGKNMREMLSKMQAGENFKPSDFGTVIAAGRDEPTAEVRADMAANYNMIDVPNAKPVVKKPTFAQPKFFGDEEDDF